MSCPSLPRLSSSTASPGQTPPSWKLCYEGGGGVVSAWVGEPAPRGRSEWLKVFFLLTGRECNLRFVCVCALTGEQVVQLPLVIRAAPGRGAFDERRAPPIPSGAILSGPRRHRRKHLTRRLYTRSLHPAYASPSLRGVAKQSTRPLFFNQPTPHRRCSQQVGRARVGWCEHDSACR